ncbi:MAG: CRTAC1 family protein [Opitutaceae bacterium]|nr:CRTAC1 family protein [Opitutaceae bacterium]
MHFALFVLLAVVTIHPLIGQDRISIVQFLREQRDQTIWKPERLAQDYETAFIELWDKLRACGNQYAPFHEFAFNSIDRLQLSTAKSLPEGIKIQSHSPQRKSILSRSEFGEALKTLENLGFRIEQTEWHHSKFEAPKDDAAKSEFSFSIHARGPKPDSQFYIVRGVLNIAWNHKSNPNGIFEPDYIGIKQIDLLTRSQAAPFEESLWLESNKRETPYSIVLVEDLNKDGFSDIVFPKLNKIYYNEGDFNFREVPLTTFAIRSRTTAAILADLNLDGKIEYVVASHEAPYLFAYTYNSDTQTFDGKPFGIWKSESPLVIAMLAAGDLTGDGYPELYLGPSTPAYEDGKMPTPYFDANDGKPAYLLRNTGGFRYEDISSNTDLRDKRGRRAYVASMLDLNDDHRMDMVVTSDFSGIDFYENTGGTLKDRTDDWVDDRSLFGMSQTFADFDRDGSMDLLAVGMSSTTARRLEKMGLGRTEFPDHQAMRMRIAYGNRLYYGNGKGDFRQNEHSENIARSGWSWGSSSLDFNNDSYPDMFISNGFLSKGTARDYCTNFWTHDIYNETNVTTSQISKYFNSFGPKALVGGNKMGWNPYEKDHLYLNLSGEGFINVAYLFGVSNGGDGRAVIGEDFDNDGRVDLLLVEQDSINASERVYIYENRLPSAGRNWIGFDLMSSKGKAFIGTRIRIIGDEYETERVYTLGEAYSGQTPSKIHFGLGDAKTIITAEVIWPDGSKTVLPEPEPNLYHRISH